MRASIIRPRNRLEPLLSSRIPDLQLDALAVELDGANLEVDADGGDVRGGEGVFGKAEETVGFTDAGVADDEKLHLSRLLVDVLNIYACRDVPEKPLGNSKGRSESAAKWPRLKVRWGKAGDSKESCSRVDAWWRAYQVVIVAVASHFG